MSINKLKNRGNIAFFGLGNMGAPMAKNLLSAGYQVAVYDLLEEAVQSLVSFGAQRANSPEQAVQNAEVVVSMLPAGQHVAGLYLGKSADNEEGLLNFLPAGALVIDCSTIDAETVKSVSQQAEHLGIGFLDAPVSGGIAGAASGTLSFMCGGELFSFEAAQPILQAMGKNIFHAGPSGAGQVAKMCNNMLLSVIMIGTSESLKLGIANGMDPTVLSNIMQASTGRNWALEVCNPCPNVVSNAPSSNSYQPGFMVDLMCKDLGLAHDNVAQNNSSAPLSALAQQLFNQHQSAGNGKLDFSSIFNAL